MFGRGNRSTCVILLLFSALFLYGGSHAEANRMEENIHSFLGTRSLHTENLVFKDINIRQGNGEYLITGKVKEGKHTICYRVEDGHDELVSETVVSKEPLSGAKWSTFRIELTKTWPRNDEVFLILYHKNEDGYTMFDNQMVIPLSPLNKTSSKKQADN